MLSTSVNNSFSVLMPLFSDSRLLVCLPQNSGQFSFGMPCLITVLCHFAMDSLFYASLAAQHPSSERLQFTAVKVSLFLCCLFSSKRRTVSKSSSLLGFFSVLRSVAYVPSLVPSSFRSILSIHCKNTVPKRRHGRLSDVSSSSSLFFLAFRMTSVDTTTMKTLYGVVVVLPVTVICLL